MKFTQEQIDFMIESYRSTHSASKVSELYHDQYYPDRVSTTHILDLAREAGIEVTQKGGARYVVQKKSNKVLDKLTPDQTKYDHLVKNGSFRH